MFNKSRVILSWIIIILILIIPTIYVISNHAIISNYEPKSDDNNNVSWQYDVQLAGPSYTEELDNGSILITDKSYRRIIEINRNKQIYWQIGKGMNKPLNQPTFATRLGNGNTLITDGLKHHRVIEVNPVGNIIWEHIINGIAGFGPNQLSYPHNKPLRNKTLILENQLFLDLINEENIDIPVHLNFFLK